MHSPKKIKEKMAYQQLHDTVVHDERAYAASLVSAKFCSLGFVTSKKWFSGYVTVLDGVVRLYDSKESCRSDAQNYIQSFQLTRNHQCSPIKVKSYSPNPAVPIDFYCFYLESGNGVLTREIKLATTSRAEAEKIVNAVHISVGKKL